MKPTVQNADAIELLAGDHERLNGLFDQFEESADDRESKLELFEAIRAELQLHTILEERIFYPALNALKSPRAQEGVKLSLRDHEQIDEMLSEIDSLAPEHPDFDNMMLELMDSVRSHIKLEQDEIFDIARAELGAERLAELGAQLERLKESEKRNIGLVDRDDE